MKPIPLIAAVVLGLGVVAAAASGRLAGWLSGPADARLTGAVPSTESASATAGCLDEAEMRRVIREELAAIAATATPAPRSPSTGPAEPSPVPVASAAQVARVDQRVDEYIRSGVISDAEMARLQSEIATLDPAARRAVMQRLVRALNSGALDGRL